MKNNQILATGYYAYQNNSDGLCEFSTKKTAVKYAEKSQWARHETPVVYSPTGKIVWEK